MNRIYNLDYLRGILSLLIVLYHYSYWSGFNHSDPSLFINKMGIYGIEIFFVLSGFSLIFIYHQYDFSPKDIYNFILNRISRLMPLFLLTIFIAWVYTTYLKREAADYSLSYILMLFGFSSPMETHITGDWSIGNEIVFYILFIFFMLLRNIISTRSYKYFLFFSSGVLLVYSAYVCLDHSVALSKQWKTYIQPINHLCFFIAGIAVFYIRNAKANYILYLSPLFLVLFSIYTISNRIDLVSGFNRIVFSLLSVLIVYICVIRKDMLKGFLKRTFLFFGDISYTLYLFHSIILSYVSYTFVYKMDIKNQLIIYTISFFLSIIISGIVHYKFEVGTKILLRNKLKIK